MPRNDRFTLEYLRTPRKKAESGFGAQLQQAPADSQPGWLKAMVGPTEDPDEVKELKGRVTAMEDQIEDLEHRLTYAEFLAGLTSQVDVVVCPADAPVHLIARKLGEGHDQK